MDSKYCKVCGAYPVWGDCYGCDVCIHARKWRVIC
jgi:hypothetical protein